MNSRFLKEAAAAAIVLLSLNNVAQAQNACTTATLKGTYGTTLHAQVLGILTGTTPNQVLHRYTTPTDVDAVALPTLDGAGAGTQEDFAMFNGTVRPGSPPDSFATNELLSYFVNADCTGELSVTFPSGSTLTQKLVIVDHGNEFFGVTNSEHIASGPRALDGTLCDKGCDIAVQASAHSVKVRKGNQQEK